jgi:hypothetical protein
MALEAKSAAAVAAREAASLMASLRKLKGLKTDSRRRPCARRKGARHCQDEPSQDAGRGAATLPAMRRASPVRSNPDQRRQFRELVISPSGAPGVRRQLLVRPLGCRSIGGMQWLIIWIWEAPETSSPSGPRCT